ncbi:MAG: hypothetical protein KDA37_12265, partial [Planctomycetales bacterium]|nr:hypothetical protein [Planctomycetales bacterium]
MTTRGLPCASSFAMRVASFKIPLPLGPPCPVSDNTAMPDSRRRIRSTTILTVRKDGIVAMGGDGQVSLGS